MNAEQILSRLQKEIEKRIEENTPHDTDYAKGAYYAYKNMEMFLTSLENSTEIPNSLTPGQEEEWKPRPQEWIEVSYDEDECDIRWIKARFIQKDSAGYYCEYENHGEIDQDYFDNVRPLEQVTIPEYKNQNTYDPQSPRSVEMHELTTQVEAITKLMHSKFPNSKK